MKGVVEEGAKIYATRIDKRLGMWAQGESRGGCVEAAQTHMAHLGS